MEVVGDAAEPDILRARSSWPRLGIAVAELCDPPKGFLRDAVPFCGESPPVRPGVPAGESAGLALGPPIRKVNFGASVAPESFNLSFGPVGSATACFA
jgi:hypothetical protein